MTSGVRRRMIIAVQTSENFRLQRPSKQGNDGNGIINGGRLF